MCNILTLHQVIICISKIIFMWCCLRMLSMSYTTRFANVLKFLLLCASWLVVFFPYYERKKKKIERQRERKLLSSLLLFTHPFLSVYSLPILFPHNYFLPIRYPLYVIQCHRLFFSPCLPDTGNKNFGLPEQEESWLKVGYHYKYQDDCIA